MTRRRWLTATGQLAATLLLPACGRAGGAGSAGDAGRPDPARLTARPAAATAPPPGPAPAPGLHALGLAHGGRDALLYVPAGLQPGAPAALVVTLHGAGGDAAGGMGPWRPVADAHSLLLLAPASRGPTWDGVLGRFGPDVQTVDRALAHVFGLVTVDPRRLTVSGFSDGASYALALGLANGDLLPHVVAFSPGFVPAAAPTGRPGVFVAHGVDDEVLPISRTSRRIVPELRERGYDVHYREFPGPHTVPAGIVREALAWLRART